MNANEIVKALHVLCGFDGKSCSGNCAACLADQFRKEHPSGACDEGTMTAAFALIESQAAKIAELNDFQNSQCAILLAKLNEAERRERAAVEAEYEFVGEMNVYPNDAEPDEDHVASICLVKCKKCGWNMFGDGWWEADYGNYQKSEQIPQHCGHCGAKFIDESGPQDEKGEAE